MAGPSLPMRGSGTDGEEVARAPSQHARDQILWGQLLLDVLAPFLTPRDLGGLARTCKAGAMAGYDEDGRSIAVSLCAQRKHGGKDFFTSSNLPCYLNFAALRFVRVRLSVEGWELGHDSTMLQHCLDHAATLQIQQAMMGPKLESFVFDWVVEYPTSANSRR